jgi:hypothetical protein
VFLGMELLSVVLSTANLADVLWILVLYSFCLHLSTVFLFRVPITKRAMNYQKSLLSLMLKLCGKLVNFRYCFYYLHFCIAYTLI